MPLKDFFYNINKLVKPLCNKIPTLNPYNNLYIIWEIIILFCVYYIFIDITFFFCFNKDLIFSCDILKIFLIVDMFILFNTQIFKNGLLVQQRTQIVAQYLKSGRFFGDLFSILSLSYIDDNN